MVSAIHKDYPIGSEDTNDVLFLSVEEYGGRPRTTRLLSKSTRKEVLKSLEKLTLIKSSLTPTTVSHPCIPNIGVYLGKLIGCNLGHSTRRVTDFHGVRLQQLTLQLLRLNS